MNAKQLKTLFWRGEHWRNKVTSKSSQAKRAQQNHYSSWLRKTSDDLIQQVSSNSDKLFWLGSQPLLTTLPMHDTNLPGIKAAAKRILNSKIQKLAQTDAENTQTDTCSIPLPILPLIRKKKTQQQNRNAKLSAGKQFPKFVLLYSFLHSFFHSWFSLCSHHLLPENTHILPCTQQQACK